MKHLIVVITLIFSVSVYAQNDLESANFFVRVYDLDGKKIGKGKIISISQASLHLVRQKETIKIPVISIGSIRTKRSTGNNVLIGATTGGAALGVLGAASADPDAFILPSTAEEGFIAGAIIGGTLGAAVGGITALFKNSKTFEINGDMENLKEFEKIILLN